MKDKLISFKTAKLAKEKGFDEECGDFFEIDNESNILSSSHGLAVIKRNNIKHFISAPTQSLLQKWLREKYHIVVQPMFIGGLTKATSWYDFIYYSNLTDGEDDKKIVDLKYKTYEEALEKGLQEALKLIKTK
jgi:hypothetical protein